MKMVERDMKNPPALSLVGGSSSEAPPTKPGLSVEDMRRKIPPTTLTKLRNLVAQRDNLDLQVKQIVNTLMDVMEITGKVTIDLDTGEFIDV